MKKIFWAADSTVQNNDVTTYPQTGIGQVFPMYVREGVFVLNHARNGRSTKSFMDEGRLDAIDRENGAVFDIYRKSRDVYSGGKKTWGKSGADYTD